MCDADADEALMKTERRGEEGVWDCFRQYPLSPLPVGEDKEEEKRKKSDTKKWWGGLTCLSALP